jgi:RimJ/RimL family protein N-acetyltransferase
LTGKIGQHLRVCDPAGRALAGSIGIFRQDNIHRRTAEMGYCIDERLWGKGVCTAAAKLACQYAFDESDILRVFAELFACNTASCRVLEKCGFQ